ncbi:sigma-54-dependent transcriptional regulator [Desulfatirhabdium butyrativorans]|uniref:sigma-54-dependent transcriptional regulator n=1 Tax=Desulfatirhabdium butyrativorans TaxID=340467 RepID=UPI00042A1B8D|nr:sigma-54 dependent transcriptional regulator [Desulfatirhabdium butyrativorans]
MEQILIIDDNELVCQTLAQLIGRMGMQASWETTLAKGMESARCGRYDVVFLDIHLPDGNGLNIIQELRSMELPPEIIIITGFSDENGAEIAIQSGAWDYIEKNTSLQNMQLSLSRAIQYRKQKMEKALRVALRRDAIIGKSPPMAACIDQAAQAANCDSPVLISGETGTGKELFARVIHENSRQAAANFVVVDCSALPENLVESILFGHQKGAFTGAVANRDGLILQAHRGTLFLDEIGELPLGIQKNFLRVLQEKRFRPLGGKKECFSDFRLISATNRDLAEMVRQGLFRQDLYYRICALHIQLPPLRERRQDIPALTFHRLERASALMKQPPHGTAPDFLEALAAFGWPGNVRELFNVIDSVLAAASDEPVLFATHLPPAIRTNAIKHKLMTAKVLNNPAMANPSKIQPTGEPQEPLPPFKTYLDEAKARYLERLIGQCGANVGEACRLSGLSRAYLYQLLQKFRKSAL